MSACAKCGAELECCRCDVQDCLREIRELKERQISGIVVSAKEIDEWARSGEAPPRVVAYQEGYEAGLADAKEVCKNYQERQFTEYRRRQLDKVEGDYEHLRWAGAGAGACLDLIAKLNEEPRS